MLSDPLPHLSPEQISARQLAARELAKYCQDFARWRKTKRGRAAMDNPLVTRRVAEVAPVKKPELPSLATAA
jgi:GH24 family phage-related lysozyme (muramidase)